MKTPPGFIRKHRRHLLWLALALAVALGWLVGDALYFLSSRPSHEAREVLVQIEAGKPLPVLADLLEREGVVRSARRFRWLVRLRGVAREIKAGEYQLSTAELPGQILDKLVRGEVFLHQITFPEGFTQQQVATLLEARGLASASRILALATDQNFVHSLDIPASSLEGYLFPDTYRFARNLPEATILRKLVARFNQHVAAPELERAGQLGLTLHQVVTLASIVEKETAVPEERPLIGGVFLNRLRRDIPLQSDPTVIYGLQDFNGNLTRSDLVTDSAYNTYTRRGLPPGPICNPGTAALQAVLYPTSTPYFYFVSKKNGTHSFSTTLPEHNAAVLRYQKRRQP